MSTEFQTVWIVHGKSWSRHCLMQSVVLLSGQCIYPKSYRWNDRGFPSSFVAYRERLPIIWMGCVCRFVRARPNMPMSMSCLRIYIISLGQWIECQHAYWTYIWHRPAIMSCLNSKTKSVCQKSRTFIVYLHSVAWKSIAFGRKKGNTIALLFKHIAYH